MEKTLTALFGYQRFAENMELQKVINSVHSRYSSSELSLDEMECVSAAGILYPNQKEEDPFGKQS